MELYIHIPFCIQKCNYCDFPSFQGCLDKIDMYLDALQKQMQYYSASLSSEVFDTVFIGGGTPSVLSDFQIARVLHCVHKYFHICPDAQISCEANPGTITASWMDAIVQNGVNRLSLGMQAYQSSLLGLLGRIHTHEDVTEAVSLARKKGMHNLNLDLMFGLPMQTTSEWIETVQHALALNPQHLSCYGLIPEQHTPLKAMLDQGLYKLPDDEIQRQMYDSCLNMLSVNGYRQYEISNFSKQNYACKHNIGYWKQVPYLGIGSSSTSMLLSSEPNCRYFRRVNPSQIDDYNMMIQKNDFTQIPYEAVNYQDAMFETFILGLRMTEGVSEYDFLRFHNVELHQTCFYPKLKELQERKLVEHFNQHWSLSRKGMDIQNMVLVELMETLE